MSLAAETRIEETMRLDWSEVDQVRGYITVSAKKAEIARRRLIPIANNLASSGRGLLEHRAGGTLSPVGFDPEHPLIQNPQSWRDNPVIQELFFGAGPIGMRERTEEMGGKLKIVSTRGVGTTITAMIPVPQCV
jgi:hypothetical protein